MRIPSIETYVVLGVEAESDFILIQSDTFIGHVFCTEIEPIPITEEWLLKLGFIKDDEDEEGMWYDIEFDEEKLCINLEGDVMIGGPYNWFVLPRKYKYVHVVQNLYFALTGKELKLKDNE